MATLAADAPDVKVEDGADVVKLLGQTVNQVRRCEIDPRVANAVGYLSSRAELPNAETNGQACDSNPAIALVSIKANAKSQWTAAIAEKWMNDASSEAIESDATQWGRWREELGTCELTTAND